MIACRLSLSLGLLSWWVPVPALSADWPMWRYDARRSAVSPENLPDDLHLQWMRQLPPPRPAWPSEQDYQGKLQFDLSYEPVVMGKTIYVPSMVFDGLSAFDTESGLLRWRFQAGGPVRFAAAAWEDRVFFVSDDGYLYCLAADGGKLLWRFRGGPSERMVLGNERLISTWPARGAPVVQDGTVYFAAGIWPFMGTFLYALDARSGTVRWTNGGSGSTFNLHQHGGAYAFGGVAPQGYLVAAGDKLLVAGGLTVPAAYDLKSGEMLFFRQSSKEVGKGAGGFAVAAQEPWYFNHGSVYSQEDGERLMSLPAQILNGKEFIGLERGALIAHAPPLVASDVEVKDKKGNPRIEKRYRFQESWKLDAPPQMEQLFMQAGNRLYGGGKDGELVAVDLPDGETEANVAWRDRVAGEVWNMLAADGKLFVITLQGRLYCFGPQPRAQVQVHAAAPVPPATAADEWSNTATEILERTGVREGYALLLGAGSGRLLEELAQRSELRLIAVDPEAGKAEALRERLARSGLDGYRAAVHAADPLAFRFPPYIASLIVAEDLTAAGFDRGKAFVEKLFSALRPYGGLACLSLSAAQQEAFSAWVAEAGLKNAELTHVAGFTLLRRVGALPGAGSWTHQYGNSSNTVFSSDTLVKAPLGVLWFGGPSNRTALPRHAQGPIPHVVGGRLIVEGVDTLSARCVYTGRVLWVVDLPEIGYPYKGSNHSFSGVLYVKNQPGANYVGSNYVSVEDGIYVLYGNACLRLDPATGKRLSEFVLPEWDGQQPDWGYLGVWNDLLIAGAGRQIFDAGRIGERNWNATSSKRLVVLNRHSGEVLWSRQAQHGFRHNAIVPAAGRIFVLDGLSPEALKLLQRSGDAGGREAELLALDARTGKVLWQRREGVFGTWLSYSEAHDVLVQAGRTGGRMFLTDEPNNRIVAHRGKDGSVLWESDASYQGPLMLNGEQIVSSGNRGHGSLHLLTGKPWTIQHPLTLQEVPWTHNRTYGCGVMLGNAHLLTFRSGAAGFYDLTRGGTGNLGGFRAGCTPNLIPADGVLNAPDYTRTCSCSFQNQTSLALVPEPEVELWTFNSLEWDGQPILRMGLNLGAPGDRTVEDGTLWLEHPEVGGPSPAVPVQIGPENVRWFRQHSTWVSGEGLPWVAASGALGVREVKLTLNAQAGAPRNYTVRLHFSEPDEAEGGRRVFSVALQGRPVLSAFDVVQAAGGIRRAVVKEFSGIAVEQDLVVSLEPAPGAAAEPVLCGIEVRAEEPLGTAPQK